MPTWDANLYLQFANERSQPAIDLIARIKLPNPKRIIDLGCGPGNSTALLRQRWPEADITGLDNSPEMIAAASKAYPGEKWVLADIAPWTADVAYDLVFSNAALQWLPEHAALFPQLIAQVAPAGALAVQIPAHYESPFHRILLEVANAEKWRQRMPAARRALTKEAASVYYNLLQPLASHLELWETEYCHILEGPQDIVAWFRGTGMRPFLEALDSAQEKQEFERMVLEGCTRAYPRQKDSRILFPFRRLFILAYR
jgi:trans-aconitate 2-methyltransferase